MESYEDHHIRDGIFTTEKGEKRDVELMYSSENCYLEDEKATGSIKYYDDYEYAFVALLPNEGVTVGEYIESVDGKHINEMLSNPKYNVVSAAIPKFETEYSIEMSTVLSDMGMTNAFDTVVADFSKIGTSSDGNIKIDRVIHKTTITLDQNGTKAGAATAVLLDAESEMIESEPPKQVFLDRPIVYMLIDCENNIPFFIGTMMDVN